MMVKCVRNRRRDADATYGGLIRKAVLLIGLSLAFAGSSSQSVAAEDNGIYSEDFMGEDYWGEIPEITPSQEQVTLRYYLYSIEYKEGITFTAKVANGSKKISAKVVQVSNLNPGICVEIEVPLTTLTGGTHEIELFLSDQVMDTTTITVPSRYYIVYEANASDATGEIETGIFYYGQKQNLSTENYERTGYLFTGWNTKANGSGKSYEPGQEIEGLTTKADATIKLYAQWTVLRYRICFLPGTEATGTMKNIVLKYGTTAKLTKNSYKKNGYTFVGWKDEAGNLYANQQQVANLITGNEADLAQDEKGYPILELTAQWKPNTYKVSYKIAGSKSPGGVTIPKITDTRYTTYQVEQGLSELPDMSAYTIWGYEFHWYRDAKYTQPVQAGDIPITGSVHGVMTTGNKTFYGKWQKTVSDESLLAGQTYQIIFDPNVPDDCPTEITVTGFDKMSEVTYTFGKKKALPANTMKLAGYSFQGWTTVSGGKIALYPNKAKVSGFMDEYGNGMQQVTLYAVWKPKTYRIRYRNAVVSKNGVDSNENPATYTVEDQVTGKAGKSTPNRIYLSSPHRIGYDFAGWYLDSQYKKPVDTENIGGEATYYLGTEIASNRTLYAKWVARTVQVSFDPNVPTGQTLVKNSDKKMVTKTYVSGKGSTILANTYQIKGLTFLGWSTTKTENTDTESFDFVANKEKIVNMTERYGGQTITLYAVWGKTTYQIMYDANAQGGTTVQGFMPVQTANINKKIRLLSNRYIRQGYTFVGWNTAMDGSGTWYENNANVQAIGKGKQKITLYAIWKMVEN